MPTLAEDSEKLTTPSIGLRIAALSSHGGSNLQAIIDACNEGRLSAKVCAVISNNSGATAVQRAKKEGIPFYHLSRKTHPDQEPIS